MQHDDRPGSLRSADRRNGDRKKVLAQSAGDDFGFDAGRSEEHTSELQSQSNLVCRLLLEKKNQMHRGEVLIAVRVAVAGPQVAPVLGGAALPAGGLAGAPDRGALGVAAPRAVLVSRHPVA